MSNWEVTTPLLYSSYPILCVYGGPLGPHKSIRHLHSIVRLEKKCFISRNLQFRETSRNYLYIGGAGVGAKTIPSYGPVYPHKGGSGPADGERGSDPTSRDEWSVWGYYSAPLGSRK